MKIQIASDLHLEFYPPAESARYRLPGVGADVLVLAGDVHQHTWGLEWAAAAETAQAVIYVPGNHEFYNAHLRVTALETRQSDSLNLYGLAVWNLKEALAAAYQAGVEAEMAITSTA